MIDINRYCRGGEHSHPFQAYTGFVDGANEAEREALRGATVERTTLDLPNTSFPRSSGEIYGIKNLTVRQANIGGNLFPVSSMSGPGVPALARSLAFTADGIVVFNEPVEVLKWVSGSNAVSSAFDSQKGFTCYLDYRDSGNHIFLQAMPSFIRFGITSDGSVNVLQEVDARSAGISRATTWAMFSVAQHDDTSVVGFSVDNTYNLPNIPSSAYGGLSVTHLFSVQVPKPGVSYGPAIEAMGARSSFAVSIGPIHAAAKGVLCQPYTHFWYNPELAELWGGTDGFIYEQARRGGYRMYGSGIGMTPQMRRGEILTSSFW